MFLNKIRPLIVFFLLLIFLFFSILLYANHLIQDPSVQGRFIEKLSQDTGLNIKTEKIELSLRQGIGINITGFDASSKSGDKFISAADVIISIATKELLKGHIVPTRIYFLEPEIDLFLKKGDLINNNINESIQEANKIPFFWTPNLYSLRIEKGQLNIINRDYGISELSLNILKKGSPSLALNLNSMGNLEIKGEKIPFRLKGILTPSSESDFIRSADLIIEAEKAPLYILPLSDPFFFKRGFFNTRVNIKNGPDGTIKAYGHITMNSVNYRIIRNDQQKDFFIPEVSLDFLSDIKGNKLDFSLITLKKSDLSLNASLNLDLENMKNPHLILSVKSDIMPIDVFKNIFPSPLLPSWVENNLLSSLKQGDIRLQLFELNGGKNELQHLSLPTNKSAIKLELECNRLLFSETELIKPIQITSSKISLGNGEFSVSGVEAKLDNSKIRRADFLMKDIFNSRAYEFSMDGIFNLNEIFQYKGIGYIPNSLRARLDKIDQISGDLDCKTTIVFEEGWKFPKILRGDCLLIDCRLQHKKFVMPLLIKKGEVRVDEAGMNEFSTEGSFGLSAFRSSGSFGISDNHIQLYKADISAEIDVNQLLPLIIDPKRFPLTFNKTLKCNISAINERDLFSFIGNVDIGGIILKTQEYSISPPGEKNNFIFDISYKRGEWIELKKSIARFGNSFIRISGRYNINPSVTTSISISTRNVSLEEFGIHLKRKSSRFKGSINGDLMIDLLNDHKESLLLNGLLQGENIFIETERLVSPLEECNFKFNLDGKSLNIDYLTLKIGKSDLSINGSLLGWSGLSGTLTIDSNYLDVGDLNLGENYSSPDDTSYSGDNDKENFDILAYLEVAKGRWRKMNIGPSRAGINLKNDNIRVIDSLINLDHGTLEIIGSLQRGSNPEISLSGNVHLYEQPVKNLFNSINLTNDKVEGNLNINADLSVNGRKKEELLSSLTGNADIALTDGVINNSRVFLKVLDILSFQNIFRKRWPGLNDNDFYFESINADSEIKNGVLKSDNFIMKSPVFNAIAYGEIDLSEKSMDFTLGVQPYGTIDTLVSNIPLLGHIITGEKKSIITYPFLVKGPLMNPDVKFIPFKGLSEGVSGIFERLFMTPARIFHDLQKGTTDENKNDSNGRIQ